MRIALLMAMLASPALADNGVKIEALLCKKIVNEQPVEPTARFAKDAPMLWGYWRSKDGREGAVVRTLWIADDVGKAAPAGTKIDEKSVAMSAGGRKAEWWWGTLSLSRPRNGWPVGKYHAEIHWDGKLVKSLPFVIE